MALALSWHGPYSFVPTDGRIAVYDAAEVDSPGVYMWTLLLESRHLVNYVGISASSVAGRQEEHMRCYLSGQYVIYSPAEFARGNKIQEFDPRNGLSEFLSRSAFLCPMILEQVRLFEIFFAPLGVDKTMLKRIESGLIEVLQEADGRAAEFLDNDRRSLWIPKEQREVVEMLSPTVFEGLPEEIRV